MQENLVRGGELGHGFIPGLGGDFHSKSEIHAGLQRGFLEQARHRCRCRSLRSRSPRPWLYRSHESSSSDTARTSRAGKPATGGAAAPVTTAPAQVEDFAIRRRTIGILESPATVVVKSRLESQVTEQHVKDGQLVKKGDVLFTLDDRVVKATIARDEAQLAKDQATADRTQLDLERYQRLSETERRRRASNSIRRQPTTRSRWRSSRPTRRSSAPTICNSTTPRSRRRSAAGSAPSA